MDEYHVYFARVVGMARAQNDNSFSAPGGKKVAHQKPIIDNCAWNMDAGVIL